MSAELDRIKKLVNNDQVVAAVEVPPRHKSKPIIVEDLTEVLSNFDEDDDYAHFVIRVKRTQSPLPKTSEQQNLTQTVSYDVLVNETLEMSEKITEQRHLPIETTATPPKENAELNGEELLSNAKILLENGDYALARNIYNALIRKGVNIPQGLAGMAQTYEKENQLDKAIRCYQEAIAYSSELSFYQSLAAIHIRLGNDEEAALALTHALGLVGLNTQQEFELHKSLGNSYTRIGDYSKAEHHYRKAYELNANSDVLQVNVGSLALQKSDMDSAYKHFQKALELNPSNDKAISGLGMIYLAKEQPQKAHDSFVASLKLNLSNLGAIYNLVKCAYELKKFNDAAQILKSYISTHPVNTNILYSYAGILYHQGEYSAALAEIARIFETNPNHSGAKELENLIKKKA